MARFLCTINWKFTKLYPACTIVFDPNKLLFEPKIQLNNYQEKQAFL